MQWVPWPRRGEAFLMHVHACQAKESIRSAFSHAHRVNRDFQGRSGLSPKARAS